MAKVALLIGVSEYEPGLTPLPAAAKDVEAMQQVLLHPEIGGFDDVTLLINPQRQAMDEAIEALFANRQRDDLLLLFFSGHGIKDEKGTLYFAACNTKKSDKGELVKATTVPANSVHSVMSNSRCKREVVILDCCFSGAFAEGMSAKDDGFVDTETNWVEKDELF
ncbi:caspase family protein [Nostoc sp.]|uniref:caspase family protein n=1 Tax=Nostoc sp. TaxID=1180 RepID=UPI002FF44BF7